MKTFDRTVVFFVLAFAAAFVPTLAGMSPSVQKLVGTVSVFGSEPHTYVGIRSEKDGRVYIPDGGETEAALRALQGKRVEFTVKPSAGNAFSARKAFPPADGTVTVISYRVLD
jgi:hypothetical protein